MWNSSCIREPSKDLHKKNQLFITDIETRFFLQILTWYEEFAWLFQRDWVVPQQYASLSLRSDQEAKQ